MATINAKRLAEIAAIPDEAIDTSDIPEATPADFDRMRRRELTVSTYLGKFLTMWATQAGIRHTWDTPPPKGPVPAWITFRFPNMAARRDALLVARRKITGLSRSKSPIVDRLRREIETFD